MTYYTNNNSHLLEMRIINLFCLFMENISPRVIVLSNITSLGYSKPLDMSDRSASARCDTFTPWCELQEDRMRCVISAYKLQVHRNLPKKRQRSLCSVTFLTLLILGKRITSWINFNGSSSGHSLSAATQERGQMYCHAVTIHLEE